MLNRFIAALPLVFAAKAYAISPFSLPWMNNAETTTQTYDTSKFPHAVFLIETYQLHCGYCEENAPNVDDIAGFYSYEPRVQVLDLGLDTNKRDYQQWIARHNPKHPVVMDAQHTVWRELRGSGTPTAYLLDCHMNVKWQNVGVWDDDAKRKLKTTIDQLLDANDCAE